MEYSWKTTSDPSLTTQVPLFYKDFSEAVSRWRLWRKLAILDVRKRYRRSYLGAIWVPLSTGVFVMAISFVYSELFDTDYWGYVQYLICGYTVWRFLSEIVSSGSTAYISDEASFRTIRLPVNLRILRCIFRSLIIFSYHIPLLIVVVIIDQDSIVTLWLLAPAALIWLIFSFGIASFLAALSLFVRDMIHVVQLVLQLGFLITPILWRVDLLPEGSARLGIALANPLFHFVEILRAPLINETPSSLSWSIASVTSVVVLVLGLSCNIAIRRRIAYWV